MSADNFRSALPDDSQERKGIPLCTGLLDYFAAALAEVAKVSVAGNNKHNPGQPLHWSRGKSNDHPNCIIRHLEARGTIGKDGIRHSAEGAWRYLALLQEELEAEGAPPSRASRFPEPEGTRMVTPEERAKLNDVLDARIKEAEANMWSALAQHNYGEPAERWYNGFDVIYKAPWYRRAWWRVLDFLGLGLDG